MIISVIIVSATPYYIFLMPILCLSLQTLCLPFGLVHNIFNLIFGNVPMRPSVSHIWSRQIRQRCTPFSDNYYVFRGDSTCISGFGSWRIIFSIADFGEGFYRISS